MGKDRVTLDNPPSALLVLVGLLYDAAAEPARWRHFLEAGASYFAAFGANLIHFKPDNPDHSFAMLTGMGNVPTDTLAYTMQRFIALRETDPRLHHGFLHPCKPFHCRQVVSTEDLHVSRAYREVLGPNGVEYTLLVTFNDTPETFTGLAFMRGSDSMAFSEADVRNLGELVPHLRRALAIQERFAKVDSRRQDAYSVLDSLPTGIVVLGADGKIEFANAAAQTLLSRRDGLSIDDDVLRAYRRSGIDLLERLLREVAATGSPRALAVERPSGRPAFRCLFSRLWQNFSEGLPNLLAAPKIVCYVGDPDQPLETPAEILQRMFGLTAGEACLTERLVAGETLASAAEHLGIKESTARDRLKTVFGKTETRSQADLVRSILSAPAWAAAGTTKSNRPLTQEIG